MNKITKSLIIIIFVFIIGLLIMEWEGIIGGFPSKIEQLEKEVQDYLLNNYKIEDIEKIKASYASKQDDYIATVIFKDELETEYKYHKSPKFGGVKQIGFGPSGNGEFERNKVKHLEK